MLREIPSGKSLLCSRAVESCCCCCGAMSTVESDEAYARRLQALEMGIRVPPPDAQTPLIHGGDQSEIAQPTENPTVLNARLNELAGARFSVYTIVVVNVPQVIIAFVMLPMYWNEPAYCGEDSSARWRWWVLFSAIRMMLFTGSVAILYVFRDWLVTRQRLSIRLTSLRNVTDAIGLVWFVIGNMYVFKYMLLISSCNGCIACRRWFFSRGSSCAEAGQSPLYILGCLMLAFNYLQICLPCILALLLIPVFCCCMPCLIRVLARIQGIIVSVLFHLYDFLNRYSDPQRAKGATEAAIELLPLVKIDSDTEGVDGSCPICLNDMVLGEEARILTCKHMFHRQCLDEWLRVNASCPTCRTSIFESKDTVEDGNSASVGGREIDSGDSSSIQSAIGRNHQHSMLPTSDTDDDSGGLSAGAL